MNWWHVIILAIVQGMAELLPVSSSAHVIIAEKLMGMNPAAPEMTLLLVMLHTGTMVAVIVYFWRRWAQAFFRKWEDFKAFAWALVVASALTALIGGIIIETIEKWYLRGQPHAYVEVLFGRLDLIAGALAAVGLLILIAGLAEKRAMTKEPPPEAVEMTPRQYALIGAVQGLAIPFRGFSRSGATISAGMLSGVRKVLAEDFSFALVIVLTPAADAREIWRLMKAQHIQHTAALATAVAPSIIGAVFAFLAGLLALKWLSRWLESGKWYIFGIYCLLAACAVAFLYHAGF
ncbi:MAG TPA: undecaprenyl-diphosphate phosphatase [Candidatus Acidoferrum sp.]|nr:undecaprenyl-diphosphate phosphatase [Candidatus Acidoferrum sp.]